MPHRKNALDLPKPDKNKVILTPDQSLSLPEFVLLKASAGSGKTYALSLRFVQFLLSDEIKKISRNDLQNILAMTFTKNAAREMKARILSWLKDCYFGEKEKIDEILSIVSLAPRQLPRKAEEVIERILSNYTDFQVETIDSFMATIFKASTVELGYSFDFEIVLENSEMMSYAFDRYLRKVTPSSVEGKAFHKILDYILANLGENTSFAWDPASQILQKLMVLYTKLAARNQKLVIDNFDAEKADLQKKISSLVHKMEGLIESSGMGRDPRSHYNSRIVPAVKGRRFSNFIGASFRTAPVKSPKDDRQVGLYERILEVWNRLENLVNQYQSCYARDFFYPYLQVYTSFAGTLDQVKRQKGIVFIEDIGQELVQYISAGIIPDIYFRLGDRIYHYLIDEFQDTSPIQWANMKPLIEESLSKGGSLFVVGDTKQAIYGFRDADYRIMKDLETGGYATFPSATVQIRELRENYRCHDKVLDFTKKVFLKRKKDSENNGGNEEDQQPKAKESEDNGEESKYESVAELSGLDHFHQEVIDRNRGKGYVEYIVLDKGVLPAGIYGAARDSPDAAGTDSEADALPEKIEIQKRVRELIQRGYSYSDIAILTYKNDSVVDISSWLNEKGIPFLPYSSLDIRNRKIIGEIMAFLRFLDSPPDELSFAVFLLGDVLRKKLEEDRRDLEKEGYFVPSDEWRSFLFECRPKQDDPLYIAFRKRYSRLWDLYFEQLFKTVGYYPLYDLVTLVFRIFNVFELFPDEEAALVKLLEIIKDFEGMGRNDLREFIEYSAAEEGQESSWTINVPSGINAVRVMSIHKAKGLGFPVVILLLYGERFQPPDFYLATDEEFVRVVKLTAELARTDGQLTRIYHEARAREAVDRLNTLYVALTRARAELYVIGVKGRRDRYPFDLVGQENYASASSKPEICPESQRTDSSDADKLRISRPFELPPNPRETLNTESIRRGDLAHKILAGLEYLQSGWDKDIPDIIRKLCPQESELALYEEIGQTLIGCFENAALIEYFKKKEARKVWREFNFCDAAGGVYRLDRVVVDEDAVTIIDFKTGAESGPAPQAGREQGDRDQIRNYIRIMKEIYPERAVQGILVYIDKKKTEILA
jgi:ATP-dependent exoDNAse (exonuclease V) beta subunit